MSKIQQDAFEIAKGEIGVKEIAGVKANIRIKEYHFTTTLKAESDEIPWCSSFVNWCIIQAGGKGTNFAWARSWLAWGKKIDKPVAGDIVIFSRGSNINQGHVGFLASKPKAYLPYVLVLGGNQNNAVNVSRYLKWNVLGYRRAEA